MANNIFLGGTIKPGTTDPVFEDTDGYGGARQLLTIEERNTIPEPYRKTGMLVYVIETDLYYKLTDDLESWDEFSGKTTSGGPTPNWGTDVITRYVRSDGNNETGDGLAPETAYLTPEYAASATKIELGQILKIDMSDYGTYTPAAAWQTPYIFGTYSGRIRFANSSASEISAFGTSIQYGDLFIYAAPTTELEIAGSSYTASVDSITGRISYTKSGADWDVDGYAGMMLVYGTGTQTGMTRIISNTNDTLLTTNASFYLSAAPTTAALRIQSESCTIDLSNAFYWFYGGSRKRYDTFTLSMAGLKFINGFTPFFQAGFNGLSLIGCTLPYGDTTTVQDTSIICCNICATGPDTSPAIQAYSPLTRIENTLIRNTWVIENRRGSIVGLCLDLLEVNGFGDGVYHALTTDIPRAATVVLTYSEFRNSVGAFRGLNGHWVGLVGFVRFINCSYGGIRMERGAQCIINGYIDGYGCGASTGGAGIAVLDNSEIFIQGTSELISAPLNESNCKIGGVTGELSVGALPYRTMADFFNGTPNRIEADTNRTGAKVYQRSNINDLSYAIETLPEAEITNRGEVRIVKSGTEVSDDFVVCLKDVEDGYNWVSLLTQEYYGGPSGYVLMIAPDGLPAWVKPLQSDFISALTMTSPNMSNRPFEGLLELGQSFAPTFTYTLSRLPVSSYRNGQLISPDGYFRDMVSLTNTDISSLSTTTLSATTDDTLNLKRYWRVVVRDAIRTAVRDEDTANTTRGLLAYMGSVANGNGPFTPTETIFTDDFDGYSDGQEIPFGQWTTSGNTGTGQQVVKSSFTITSPGGIGVCAPHSGINQLFIGNLVGTTLSPINGRRTAKVVLDLTSVADEAVKLTFWKRQVGNDTLTYAGFTLTIDIGAGPEVLINEEINTEAWQLKEVDLTSYIGETGTLSFEAFDDNAGGDPVGILIDDVLVQSGNTDPLTPPEPEDITEAYIKAIEYSTIVARPEYPLMNLTIDVVSEDAQAIVAYPVDLPQPLSIFFNIQNIVMPLTLLKDNVAVTNEYDITKNYNVYLTAPLGFINTIIAQLQSFEPYGDYFNEVMADEPVLYWRCNEQFTAESAIAEDSSGNEYDGVFDPPEDYTQIYRADSLIADVGNGSLKNFASPNTFSLTADITSSSLAPPTTSEQGFTIEWWAQTIPSFSPQVGTKYTVMGTETESSSPGQFYIYFKGTLTNYTDSQFVAGWIDGSMELITAVSGGVISETIRHYVAVFAYSNIKIYIDGVLVGTQNVTAPSGSSYTQFGAPTHVAGANMWRGDQTLDEIAFYDTPLTAERILAHYEAGIGTS